MNKDINCSNFQGLLGYLRNHHGDKGVRQTLDGLVDNERYLVSDKNSPSKIIPVQEHHLTDSAYWVSNDFSLALFANARKVIGGSNPFFHAGEIAVSEHFSKKSVLFFSKVAGIKYIARRASKLNARFNRTKEVIFSELKGRSVIFEFNYHPNFTVTKDICNWNLGIYSGLAKMTEATGVKCKEIECVNDGDARCKILMTWEKEPPLLNRIFRWILRAGIQDVIAEYETTVKERDALIDNLTQSEEKYRTVLAANPNPVVVYDHEEKVIYLNPAFTRIFGWTIEERLGKKMDLFVPEENWQETQMMIDKVRAGEDFSDIETRRLTKAGKMIDVSISAAVYRDSDGNPIGSAINLRDITVKKKIRAEAMRVGQLASLGELAAGVAHEINNPISGVIGYAEILKDRFEEQGQNVDIPEKIIKEGERIALIVRNLLSFARDRKEEYSPSSIKDILSETLGLVERQIIKDGITFSLDIPPDLPPVNARSKEIQHVFLNIINNARYALNQRFPKSSEDKFLKIKCKSIENKERRYVRTTFFDGGTGMPDHVLNRVSEPFFSTKPKDEGIGLGLSMSHGIIQDHDGRLLFESMEGAYTKVMVDLPAVLGLNRINENDNGT